MRNFRPTCRQLSGKLRFHRFTDAQLGAQPNRRRDRDGHSNVRKPVVTVLPALQQPTEGRAHVPVYEVQTDALLGSMKV